METVNNAGTSRVRTRVENLKFKLNLAFMAWLVGMLLICAVFLSYRTVAEDEYSTFKDAAIIHACFTVHQFANTEIPILGACNQVWAVVAGNKVAIANQTHINRSPIYSAVLVFGLAAFLL